VYEENITSAMEEYGEFYPMMVQGEINFCLIQLLVIVSSLTLSFLSIV